MTRWKRWTDDEVEIVRQCQEQGMTARQAAERLVGRSVAVIRLKAKEEGFPFPLMTLTSEPPVMREKERELVRVPDRNYSSFTSRLMGDPAPGRSALDQRGAR